MIMTKPHVNSLANLKMPPEEFFSSSLSYQKLALGKQCIKTISDLKFPWLSHCIHTHTDLYQGFQKVLK